jgi:hypothetical protein
MSKAIDRVLGIGKSYWMSLSAITGYGLMAKLDAFEPDRYRGDELIAFLLPYLVKHAKRCHRQQAGR